MPAPRRRAPRVFALLLLAACAGEPAAPPAPARAGIAFSRAADAIEVASAAALYDAVNDPANAGRVVEIDSGTYMLDSLQAHNGRLELQPGMTLRGATGRPEDVVLDAGDLRAPHLTDSTQLVGGLPMLTGAIRVGRDQNTVEALTISNASAGAAGIETDLFGSAMASVTIRNVIATGNQRGIDVRNIGAAMAGRTLVVALSGNQLSENLAGQGQGVRFVNAQGATGARILATLDKNTFVRNLAGCLAANLNVDSAGVSIQSRGDLFATNGNGCVLLAGNSSGASYARGNTMTFAAQATQFENNGASGAPAVAIPNALTAIGAVSQRSGHASGNSLDVELQATGFSGNLTVDIAAWGAQTAAALPAGTDNHVVVGLQGSSKKATVDTTASTPVDPSGTNTVVIVR